LIVAAAGGHAAVTELLLGHGAAIDVVNNAGERPLTSASQKGYTDVVAALLRFGGDMNQQNRNGATALQENNHPDV
jgi:ankyrin repeat protein